MTASGSANRTRLLRHTRESLPCCIEHPNPSGGPSLPTWPSLPDDASVVTPTKAAGTVRSAARPVKEIAYLEAGFVLNTAGCGRGRYCPKKVVLPINADLAPDRGQSRSGAADGSAAAGYGFCLLRTNRLVLSPATVLNSFGRTPTKFRHNLSESPSSE